MNRIYTDFGSYSALADNGKFKFYYGAEAIDENSQEWMFEVIKNGKVVFEMTNSELMALCDTDTQSPKDMLLTGILAYLSR